MPASTLSPPRWVVRYLGLPYAEADCFQLAARVRREVGGLDTPLYDEEYEHAADEVAWANGIRAQVVKIVERERLVWPRVEGEPECFDIALYRLYVDGADAWHVALCLGCGWALTTTMKRGAHPIQLRHAERTWRLDGIYRPRAS